MFHFQDFGTFARSLKCFPVVMMGGKERKDVDKGGKIILPPSALDHLTRLHIQFPMLFKLTNRGKNRETHCGVLEFVAEEGRCYLPYWMMKNLLLKEGEIIDVKYVNLEIAKFAKFQPQSVDFLEISNPKAVLENSLRNFATLTKGDVISINYNDKDYEVCILETRPGNAVSIIECDMDVDFAPPVGYEEPAKIDKFKPAPDKNLFINNKEKPPVHEGYRLDGKPKKNKYPSISSSVPGTSSSFGGPGSYGACAASSFTGASSYESNSSMLVTDGTIGTSTNKLNDESLREEETKGSPYYDYQIGLLRFNRNFSNLSQNKESNEIKPEPQVKGYKLRDIKVN